ncbi:M48 family metalloprotease [Spongiibacter taiwanensis]|uniref:M48 family metalloprotease n=1 Tax=Spongiibacter taiwanensis TaxID=1748242 RepID=UPI002035DAC1|nr:M48 family metalloprotease [Spongiibacter taiwanensis]USA44077.1 M48 family metalloprotease [Spongiibacter taiwanensis]
MKRFLSIAVLVGGSALALADDDFNLPDLGDVTASRYSQQQEHDLGRAWLKMFRSQVQTIDDPLAKDYVESLLYKLAANSELKDRRLETVVVDNATINAFAVPGGVIGVHSGLFLHTDNEAQLAGVLAHEIAHLSQRHFSRSMDKAQQSTIPTLAGILAGVVLAATTGSDAGIAAITATQAAALENQLRFSREHEQEADRVGMETMVKADMDPNGVPSMFENMNAQYRYRGSNPPEFLLTHPLTESRINDSRNRARQYPRKVYTDNLNYQLVKMRMLVHHSDNKESLIKQWQRESGINGEARRYGIVSALIALERWSEAEEQLKPLLAADPGRIAYQLAEGEILNGKKQYKEAIALLQEKLALTPHNQPLTMALASALQGAGRFEDADKLLTEQSRHQPGDPALWYELAEVRGLAGNIMGVHLARSEYFVLNGQFQRAQSQLRYAYKDAPEDSILRRRIRERLREIGEMQKFLESL